jgi:mannose-6-phosphate isomerase-like protein (cupin superfamily)
MSMGESLPALRRVVTGHDALGATKVLSDAWLEPLPHLEPAPRLTYAWCSTEMPCDIATGEAVADMRHAVNGMIPPRNGTQVGIIDLPPRFDSILHRTETLDYVVVLSGDVGLVLDTEEVALTSGDVVVQRGTQHRWRNRTEKPARMLFVMLDARPPDPQRTT